MSTFRNVTDDQVDIPLLDLHIGPGETFEIPDELAGSLEANPLFASSKAKHPDQTPTPAFVEAATAVPTAPVAIITPADPDPGYDPAAA